MAARTSGPASSGSASRLLGYLRSRTVDHWLMFLAGLVIGLIIG